MAKESEVATSMFSVVLGEMQEMRDSMLCLEQSWKALIAERDEIRDERNRAVSALAEQVAVLRKERDEARRMACEKEETLGCDERGVPRNGSARDHAKQRGWDCFKEDSNG